MLPVRDGLGYKDPKMLITATIGDLAHAEGHLDASYTISFARIPVGELTATAVFGQNEYAMSARARAGGVLKALLVDGEASFSTQGTIKDEGAHSIRSAAATSSWAV